MVNVARNYIQRSCQTGGQSVVLRHVVLGRIPIRGDEGGSVDAAETTVDMLRQRVLAEGGEVVAPRAFSERQWSERARGSLAELREIAGPDAGMVLQMTAPLTATALATTLVANRPMAAQ